MLVKGPVHPNNKKKGLFISKCGAQPWFYLPKMSLRCRLYPSPFVRGCLKVNHEQPQFIIIFLKDEKSFQEHDFTGKKHWHTHTEVSHHQRVISQNLRRIPTSASLHAFFGYLGIFFCIRYIFVFTLSEKSLYRVTR